MLFRLILLLPPGLNKTDNKAFIKGKNTLELVASLMGLVKSEFEKLQLSKWKCWIIHQKIYQTSFINWMTPDLFTIEQTLQIYYSPLFFSLLVGRSKIVDYLGQPIRQINSLSHSCWTLISQWISGTKMVSGFVLVCEIEKF